MDMKHRTPSKLSKTPLLSEKKKSLEPKYSEKESKCISDFRQETKYSEKESKCISDLKKLYLDTIKLDVELQHGIYNMEKSFESKHDEIYDKRMQMLENFKKQNQGGDATELGNINNFWLKVLKSSYTEFISKRDEKILVFLSDIRSKLYNEPLVKFVIEFYFEPNDFFTNRILTKTYFLNCLPDVDDPFTYDGAEIYKCEGCKIDWKHPEKEKDKKSLTSFFDFFDPPTLPDNHADPTYADINFILQNDFELGFYLKERVIPKAILFFTGEIADCLSSDSETESDEDDDGGVDNDGDETKDVGATKAGN